MTEQLTFDILIPREGTRGNQTGILGFWQGKHIPESSYKGKFKPAIRTNDLCWFSRKWNSIYPCQVDKGIPVPFRNVNQFASFCGVYNFNTKLKDTSCLCIYDIYRNSSVNTNEPFVLAFETDKFKIVVKHTKLYQRGVKLLKLNHKQGLIDLKLAIDLIVPDEVSQEIYKELSIFNKIFSMFEGGTENEQEVAFVKNKDRSVLLYEKIRKFNV